MNRKLVLGVIGIFSLAIAPHLDRFPVRAHESKASITCSYDPNSGKPNPFGMRTYITAEEKDGDSIFTYEQFPSHLPPIKTPAKTLQSVSLASTRTLIFHSMNMSDARMALRENLDHYAELVGYHDEEGFARFDEIFKCVNS